MVSGEWWVQNFCGQMCSGFQPGNNNHTSTDTEVFWHSGALQIGLLLLLLLTMTGLRSKLTQWLQREETSLPLCWVPYATIHTLSFYLPSLHSVVAPGWVSSLKKKEPLWIIGAGFFYTPDAVLVIQPSVSQHTRELVTLIPTRVSVC